MKTFRNLLEKVGSSLLSSFFSSNITTQSHTLVTYLLNFTIHYKNKKKIPEGIFLFYNFTCSRNFFKIISNLHILHFRIYLVKILNDIDIDHLKQFCDAIGIMKSNNTITIITKSAKYLYQILEDARK